MPQCSYSSLIFDVAAIISLFLSSDWDDFFLLIFFSSTRMLHSCWCWCCDFGWWCFFFVDLIVIFITIIILCLSSRMVSHLGLWIFLSFTATTTMAHKKNIFAPNCGVALYHCVTNFGTCSKYQFGLFTLYHSSFSVSVSLHVISLITVNISFTNHFGNVRYSMSFGWRRRHHSSHSRVTLVTGTCQRCQYIHITGKELVKLWWYWALLRVCAWYLNSILTFKKKNVLRRQHKKLPFYEDSTRDERERK